MITEKEIRRALAECQGGGIAIVLSICDGKPYSLGFVQSANHQHFRTFNTDENVAIVQRNIQERNLNPSKIWVYCPTPEQEKKVEFNPLLEP